MPIAPRERLIVALDLPSLEAAQAMVDRLGDAASFYKIGYQLAYAGGLPYTRTLADAGKQVFLDLKLHDIGNTVAEGVRSVSRLGAAFLTVHAYPQTMKAAVQARERNLQILAVTVLTSYNDRDLAAAGYGAGVRATAAQRAESALEIGVDGLICSPEEAANLRAIVGHDMLLVTPGIRPAGAEIGDQKRVTTPAARNSASSKLPSTVVSPASRIARSWCEPCHAFACAAWQLAHTARPTNGTAAGFASCAPTSAGEIAHARRTAMLDGFRRPGRIAARR